jgi:hypothetical protein
MEQPRLAPEAPLSAAERERLDFGRFDATIDSLLQQFAFFAEAKNNHRKQTNDVLRPLIMGLFGGLGQGKSTVVEAVNSKLEIQSALTGVCGCERGWRITRFDTSLYKADDLEHRLISILLSQGFVSFKVVAGLLAGLGGYLLWLWLGYDLESGGRFLFPANLILDYPKLTSTASYLAGFIITLPIFKSVSKLLQ